MSRKTKKDEFPLYSRKGNISPRLAIAAAALVGAAAGTGAYFDAKSHSDGKVPPNKAELMAAGRAKLEGLRTTHSNNVINVQTDAAHPEYEQVTFAFSPGENTISAFAGIVAPDDPNAIASIESYNNNLDLVKYGTDNALTVDVDPVSGNVVPKTELEASAQVDG